MGGVETLGARRAGSASLSDAEALRLAVPAAHVRSALLGLALTASASAQAPGSRGRVSAVSSCSATTCSTPSRRSTGRIGWPTRCTSRRALHVIRRELLLDVGDPFDSALVAESERNLRALGIFRDVEIDPVQTDTGIVLRVRTADAWTTTMGVSVATSGSESIIDLSLQESNLLGTRTVALRRLSQRSRSQRHYGGVRHTARHRRSHRRGRVDCRALRWTRGHGIDATPVPQPFVEIRRVDDGVGLPGTRPAVSRAACISDSLWREFAILRADGADARSRRVRAATCAWDCSAQYLRDDIVPLEDRDNIPRTRSGTAGPYIAAARAAVHPRPQLRAHRSHRGLRPRSVRDAHAAGCAGGLWLRAERHRSGR